MKQKKLEAKKELMALLKEAAKSLNEEAQSIRSCHTIPGTDIWTDAEDIDWYKEKACLAGRLHNAEKRLEYKINKAK